MAFEDLFNVADHGGATVRIIFTIFGRDHFDDDKTVVGERVLVIEPCQR